MRLRLDLKVVGYKNFSRAMSPQPRPKTHSSPSRLRSAEPTKLAMKAIEVSAMSNADNSNTVNDALASLFFGPVADMRKSILGDADLRSQWMSEYGINTQEAELVREIRQPVSAAKSHRREYFR